MMSTCRCSCRRVDERISKLCLTRDRHAAVIWGNESFVVSLADGIGAVIADRADLRIVNGSGVER